MSPSRAPWSAQKHWSAQKTVRWLAGWTSLCNLLLIASTWPLWATQTTFPAVPAIEWLCPLPIAVDWICLGVLHVGLLLMLVGKSDLYRYGIPCVLAAGLLLVALNQHRLQPWFYQLLLFSSLFLLRDRTVALCWLRRLVISVYFFSALSKFDYEFLHTVGPQFLHALVGLFPSVGAQEVLDPFPLILVGAIPVTELMIAVALMSSRLQVAVGLVACLFHLALIVLLSPLGMNHSWGVILWNLQFAIQACLLFSVKSSRPDQQIHHSQMPTRSDFKTLVFLAAPCLAIVMPLVERNGLWDHWTSWALYAPHSSRTEVFVARTAIDELPDDLRQLIPGQQNESLLWIRIPLAAWSLESLHAPVYPQARFQLGVARALARRLASDDLVRVEIKGTASRFHGHRTTIELRGTRAIESAGNRFLLGTRPRTRK